MINLTFDLVNTDKKEIEELLNELPKEELVRIIVDLKDTLKEDYEQFNIILENQPFERIRRITGYLVGTVERFNDGKKAEEHDRVKHNI